MRFFHIVTLCFSEVVKDHANYLVAYISSIILEYFYSQVSVVAVVEQGFLNFVTVFQNSKFRRPALVDS